MTDFVIVVAALASIASTGLAAPGAAPALPDRTPTVGFRTYATVEVCGEAASQPAARPGTRLVCLPIGTQTGELASAY